MESAGNVMTIGPDGKGNISYKSGDKFPLQVQGSKIIEVQGPKTYTIPFEVSDTGNSILTHHENYTTVWKRL